MSIENKSEHIIARVTPSAKHVIKRAAEVAQMRTSTWIASVVLAEANRELQRELERLHQETLAGAAR